MARDSVLYGTRTAGLAWAEAVTLISEDYVPDAVCEQPKQHFTDEELVNLTMVTVAINGWNRLEITFRRVPGQYQPAKHQTEALVS